MEIMTITEYIDSRKSDTSLTLEVEHLLTKDDRSISASNLANDRKLCRNFCKWEEQGLLVCKKYDVGHKRYYTFVESMWVYLVMELRCLGTSSKIIKAIKESLYKHSPKCTPFDYIVSEALLKNKKLILAFTSEGKVNIIDITSPVQIYDQLEKLNQNRMALVPMRIIIDKSINNPDLRPITERLKTQSNDCDNKLLKNKQRIKVKPSFYAYCFEPLKEIALDFGYNLVMHGSLNRDFDLIAVPWQDEVKDEFELIQEMSMFLNGTKPERKEDALWSVLAGGRSSYVININRGGRFNNYEDQQWYLDVSITPKK